MKKIPVEVGKIYAASGSSNHWKILAIGKTRNFCVCVKSQNHRVGDEIAVPNTYNWQEVPPEPVVTEGFFNVYHGTCCFHETLFSARSRRSRDHKGIVKVTFHDGKPVKTEIVE